MSCLNRCMYCKNISVSILCLNSDDVQRVCRTLHKNVNQDGHVHFATMPYALQDYRDYILDEEFGCSHHVRIFSSDPIAFRFHFVFVSVVCLPWFTMAAKELLFACMSFEKI